jgi:hypothetical protein
MAFGNHGKNGRLGFTFATYLILASFVLVLGRYQGWYQVRPDYGVDVPVKGLFERPYDARLVCPEQRGVRVLTISAPTVEAARELIARDLPLCEIRSVVRHRN